MALFKILLEFILIAEIPNISTHLCENLGVCLFLPFGDPKRFDEFYLSLFFFFSKLFAVEKKFLFQFVYASEHFFAKITQPRNWEKKPEKPAELLFGESQFFAVVVAVCWVVSRSRTCESVAWPGPADQYCRR